MSRTDKDRPSWVRAYDRLEPRNVYHHHRTWRGEPLDCDLHLPRPRSRSEQWARNCTWYSARPRRMHYNNVPGWYVAATWSAPERVRVRDVLAGAAREYNAGGDLEDFDFPSYAHRHCAAWDWD